MEDVLNYECPITHLEDNQPSITAIKNGASQALRYMSKSQRISIPFLHDVFTENDLDFVCTAENIADIFTKFLPVATHWKHLRGLGLRRFSEIFGYEFPYEVLSP